MPWYSLCLSFEISLAFNPPSRPRKRSFRGDTVMYPFNVPFKIISLIETSRSIGGAKREYPGKTTWHTRKQNLSCLTCGQRGARTYTRHSGEMIELLRALKYSDLTHSATGVALSKPYGYVTNILKICINKLDAKKIRSILQNN